jgi:hypothetical protein
MLPTEYSEIKIKHQYLIENIKPLKFINILLKTTLLQLKQNFYDYIKQGLLLKI